MHVIVVGCGRVGSDVARNLALASHDVVVVDRKAEAFRRLGDDFSGKTLVGVGFDRELLAAAGITEQSAVAAVTSGDNSNILIARVAKETFGASHVVASSTIRAALRSMSASESRQWQPSHGPASGSCATCCRPVQHQTGSIPVQSSRWSSGGCPPKRRVLRSPTLRPRFLGELRCSIASAIRRFRRRRRCCRKTIRSM